MKNIHIITGGPGFGKTTLIEGIVKRGINGSEELSRQFIQEQMKSGGELLPWINRLGYSEVMLERRIKQYEDTSPDELWFFDLGIPDLIAYIIKDGYEVPDIYYKAARKPRYNQIVFLTPPWREIHENDSERKESFEEAEEIHDKIKRTYQSLDYNCVDVPKTSVKERVKFILSEVNIKNA